jgi:hypothetical protein
VRASTKIDNTFSAQLYTCKLGRGIIETRADTDRLH